MMCSQLFQMEPLSLGVVVCSYWMTNGLLTPLSAPAVGPPRRSQSFGSCYYVSPLLNAVPKHHEAVGACDTQVTLDDVYLSLILICKLHILLWSGWWFCLRVMPEFWLTLLCSHLWLLYRLSLVTSQTCSIVIWVLFIVSTYISAP